MKRCLNIFDLDGTLIDSTHRINKTGKLEDGVDMQYWLDHSTPEFIAKDKLLPLVEIYKLLHTIGYYNIAVTARSMTEADFEYLKANGLMFDEVLHREDSLELDHILKDKLLDNFFKKTFKFKGFAFDDKQQNVEVFKKYGFHTYNAENLNELLKAFPNQKDWPHPLCDI